MIKYFKKKYALSDQGSKDLIKSIFWAFLRQISLMLPIIFAFAFLNQKMPILLGETPKVDLSVWFYIGISVGLFILIYLVGLVQYDTSYKKTYLESAQIRIDLADKLKRLPLAFYSKRDIADLSGTIMSDVVVFEQAFSNAVPNLHAFIVTLTLISISLISYNYKLGLLMLWVVPTALMFFILFRKLQKKYFKELQDERIEINEKTQEGLDLIYELKAYEYEDIYFEEKINKKIIKHEKNQIAKELMIGSIINGSLILLDLGLITLVIAGAFLLYNKQVTVFDYVMYIIASVGIYSPFKSLIGFMAELLHLSVRVDRKKEMDNMPIQEGSKEFAPSNYDIEFTNVSFAYEKDSRETIKDVSFTAKQGEVTALVGPSGGGKTTLARLAARFWDIDNGTITLGGSDISKIDPETLLESYSIVFQDVLLFNYSVLDNIRIGKKDATDEQVKEAARLAQCDEFVSKLPDGYNTLIGENGERISGGERQRISIARAILKQAPIILLDEATASLDAENESKIQRAISELIKDKTVIVIAHRMRTVMNADKIVVVKDGQIAEQGAPKQLLKQGGVFANMNKLADE